MLVVSSVLVLEFESFAPPGAANIETGGEALWWAVVTITTVGYGDFFPVTFFGRLTGVAVMFAGVGIIGALASILASILVPQRSATGAGARRGRTGRREPIVGTHHGHPNHRRHDVRRVRAGGPPCRDRGPPSLTRAGSGRCLRLNGRDAR